MAALTNETGRNPKEKDAFCGFVLCGVPRFVFL